MDIKEFLEDFEDRLAPRLDTYEQALYLYVFRHSRLVGLDEVVIGFKSARRRLAFGVGEKGKPMSEGTCYEKLRSLQQKGCLQLIGSERDGTRLRLRLPSEVLGARPSADVAVEPKLEEIDFFEDAVYRPAILRREGSRCFYCLCDLSQANYVIEHVASRPTGDSGYKNVVAACRSCNNRKGEMPAEDFLRNLYRSARLSESEFENRLIALKNLRAPRP